MRTGLLSEFSELLFSLGNLSPILSSKLVFPGNVLAKVDRVKSLQRDSLDIMTQLGGHRRLVLEHLLELRANLVEPRVGKNLLAVVGRAKALGRIFSEQLLDDVDEVI